MLRVVALLALLALPLAASAGQKAAPTTPEAEIQALRGRLSTLGLAEQGGERTMSQERARLELLNIREGEITARIARNQGQLVRLLSALQSFQRQPPPPLLVTPRSAKDAVRAAILIRAIAPGLEARGRTFAAQAEQIRKLRRTAAIASAAYFRAESEVAEGRVRIDALAAEKQALERQLHTDADAEARARGLAARSGTVGELVQGLALRGRADAPDQPLKLIQPVQGKLERRFGQRSPGGGRSEGWTYLAREGAVVLSPAEGQVDYAGPLKGWGLVVILRISGGYHLVLAGLDKVTSNVGRPVAAGEPVGRMAEAGGAMPSLYLEVRKNAAPVDPGRWLPAT